VGTTITVTGTVSATNTYGAVFFDTNLNGINDPTEPIQFLATSATGTFSTTLIVPSVSPGTYPIVASFAIVAGQSLVKIGEATFTVTTTAITTSSIVLSPTSGPVGTTITVNGSGSATNAYGAVFFDINRNGSNDPTEPIQFLRTSATGTFSTTLIVPSVSPGTYPIVAAFTVVAGQSLVKVGEATFTVTGG